MADIDAKTLAGTGPATRDRRYLLGLAGVFLAALAASSAGILLRQIEAADGWQILFYRSLAFVAVLLAYIVAQRRRDTLRAFLAIGWPGLVVALALGSAFIAFIFAMLLTTVAQAVFILSAAPFFAALLGLAVLRERVAPLTWISMAAALAGVGVMMAQGLVGGSASGGAFLGSLVALAACLGYAAAIVALRAGRRVDMMPATCLAGVFAGGVCFFLADDLAIGGRDLTFALLLGSAQIGLQYLLITLSARHVPAAQIALVMLVEVVLAPLWVWLGVGEAPSPATLLGGAIVLAAVLAQTLHALRTAPDG
jgi:drug/metabolite transporter (DMT)-like permease